MRKPVSLTILLPLPVQETIIAPIRIRFQFIDLEKVKPIEKLIYSKDASFISYIESDYSRADDLSECQIASYISGKRNLTPKELYFYRLRLNRIYSGYFN